MAFMLLRAFSILAFLFVVLPCTVMGILGLLGRLSDTSESENLRHGLTFLGIAFATFVACLLTFVFGPYPKKPDRSQDCG